MTGGLEARRSEARWERERGRGLEAAKILQQPIVFSASEEKAIYEAAKLEADEWCGEIETRCKAVLKNAQAGYDAGLVRQQLRAAILKGVTFEPDAFARRGRAMKVRDKAAHQQMQAKSRSLSAVRERVLREVLATAKKEERDRNLSAAERARAREVARRIEGKAYRATVAETQRLRTLWNRQANAKIVRRAVENEKTVYLQWTTKRDGRVCEICEPYDLWVVKKGADEVGMYSPPLHPRCRCLWMEVSRENATEFGIKPSARPDVEPADGFGGLRL